MDKNTTINELDINDEFTIADSNITVSEIAQELSKLFKTGDNGTVLISQDNEIIGFISDKEIIDSMASNVDIIEKKAIEIMNTDYVEVMEDETLGNIIPIISTQYPNAIVVLGPNRKCVGFFSQNDYKDAMASLGVYNQSHEPETPDEWRTKGIAMSSLGKRIEALKCYEKSLISSSNKEKSWTELANRLERINKRKDAIMCIDKALSINSNNDRALIERGKLYSEEKTQNLAIQSYKLALAINPENVEALMSMGIEQANLGDIEKALSYLNKVENIEGENAELWFRKGTAYEIAKQYENALDCYNRAIKMDESFVDAWFNKGVTLNMIGKENETLQCMEKILKINPDNESAREAISFYEVNKSFSFD